MSITVKQAVLHQLQYSDPKKTAQTNLENINAPQAVPLKAHLRHSLLPLTDDVDNLLLTLHQAYQGKSKGYGVFQENSLFAQNLNLWLENDIDFLQFSASSTEALAAELSQRIFAQPGTVIVCHYSFLATDYLFFALLDHKEGMSVDDHLDIHPTHALEVQRFDVACRINLSELQNNAQSNRYLTFAKGRIGRNIGDFFLTFLGAEEGLDAKVQNQCLLQAVHDFCTENELSAPARQEVKTQVFDYCQEQIKNGEEIKLQELSEQMPTLNSRSFANFTENAGYDLEAEFPPVKNSLKTLKKFSGSGKGVTISFDASLLNGRVQWDEENDRLIIQDLPPNLRDQLEKAK